MNTIAWGCGIVYVAASIPTSGASIDTVCKKRFGGIYERQMPLDFMEGNIRAPPHPLNKKLPRLVYHSLTWHSLKCINREGKTFIFNFPPRRDKQLSVGDLQVLISAQKDARCARPGGSSCESIKSPRMSAMASPLLWLHPLPIVDSGRTSQQ